MTTDDIPAAPKKPKPRKKRARRAPAKKATEAVAYPGLTVTDCAKACGANGCALGTPYCAHPRKGGLQAADMGNAAVLDRLHKAQKQLAVTDAAKRFS